MCVHLHTSMINYLTAQQAGLCPCLLYSVFFFNSVVCRLLSVSY